MTARMEPRLSLITLGVADPARSRVFYEALGFSAAFENADVVFIPLGGLVLSLFRSSEMDADMKRQNAGPGAVALAYNTRAEDEVDPILAAAVKAGGTLLKPGKRAEWGGYSGYFADPDGHAWEIAFNPAWSIDAEGRVSMNG